jgi:hypothetical protein
MQHMVWWQWYDLLSKEGHVGAHSITQHVTGVKLSQSLLPTCRSVTDCHAEYVQQVNKKLTDKGLHPQVGFDGKTDTEHDHHIVAASGSTATE